MTAARLPRIAICGQGECGKDEAARWFAGHTPLRLGRTTSEVIAPYRAAQLGVSVEEAFARRREERDVWLAIGDQLRRRDPAYLVRESLKDGEIAVGLRDLRELGAARVEGLVDLAIWIERRVPRDRSMRFGAWACDVVIDNHATIAVFHGRLRALATFAGILREDRG